MNKQHHIANSAVIAPAHKTARKLYMVTDAEGKEYTGDTVESNARAVGEMMAEFEPDKAFFLVPHSLH